QRLAMSTETVRPNIESYQLQNGKTVYLLAEGRLVNLAAADGHPIEIMDLSFAVQTRSLAYVATQGTRLSPALIPVPDEIDERIARDALEVRQVRIDQLSSEQIAYRSQF
ncbi:MAG: adenosylhomocysteinase, partial [Firmicutes bacterium]|nr:adenosylhomocysteinase [Bacillota bacterium]